MASALLKMVGRAAKSSASWTWQNSGAEDVPILRGAKGLGNVSWFGKGVRSKKKTGPERDEQDRFIGQPGAERRPKLTPVDGTEGVFKRESAANDPAAAIQKNREANERALEASRLAAASREGSGDATVPKQMAEDIHEIRNLLEEQARSMPTEGGLGAGIFGAIGRGLKFGKLGGVFKGMAGKLPALLRAGSGLGAAGLLGSGAAALMPKVMSIPKGIQGTFGRVTTMGASAADAAKSRLGAVSAAGKGLLDRGAGVARQMAGKAGAKSLIKKIPGIGLLAGVGFGVARAAQGDFTGAGLEVASGLAGTVPGIGTAASLGLDVALADRDAGAASAQMKQDAVNVDKLPEKKRSGPLQPAVMSSESDAVPRGIANLQNFVAAAMDPDAGIFVRVVKDTLKEPGIFERNMTPGTAARESKRPGQITPSKPAAPAKNFEKIPRTADELANSPLGDLISRGEGDYDSYNSGTKGVSGGKIGHSGKKNLSQMTLNEIIASSESKDGNDPDRIFAAGRYQVITPTLKRAMKSMGLKGDEKFTPELQDRIFKEALLPRQVSDFITGKSDDMDSAQLALAKEWRSFADPRTGKTYADSGAKANKASIMPAEAASALMATRAKFELNNPEVRTTGELEQVAFEKRSKEAVPSGPVVIPVSQPSPAVQPKGGDVGFGGHMGTRNGDSSIKRLTDAKMSYGLS